MASYCRVLGLHKQMLDHLALFLFDRCDLQQQSISGTAQVAIVLIKFEIQQFFEIGGSSTKKCFIYNLQDFDVILWHTGNQCRFLKLGC